MVFEQRLSESIIKSKHDPWVSKPNRPINQLDPLISSPSCVNGLVEERERVKIITAW